MATVRFTEFIKDRYELFEEEGEGGEGQSNVTVQPAPGSIAGAPQEPLPEPGPEGEPAPGTVPEEPPVEPVSEAERYMVELEKRALMFDPSDMTQTQTVIFMYSGKVNPENVDDIVQSIQATLGIEPGDSTMENSDEKPQPESEKTRTFTQNDKVDYAETAISAIEFNPEEGNRRNDAYFTAIREEEVTHDNARAIHSQIATIVASDPGNLDVYPET